METNAQFNRNVWNLFGFGVKFGGNLEFGKAILTKTREEVTQTTTTSSYFLIVRFWKDASHLWSSQFYQFSSVFAPDLSSDSILIKWRHVSAVSGIGS
jgi:hypothetical protein